MLRALAEVYAKFLCTGVDDVQVPDMRGLLPVILLINADCINP